LKWVIFYVRFSPQSGHKDFSSIYVITILSLVINR